ncbi:sensor histidine kinase [Alteromonas facilis]|uniref:sensor histidine kinase n=1 Tax=Alteromonas facilis TaxID=2048004 RepID=UPI000C28FF26|nr:ATP-binding protein [Alteromonas facilis]
MSEELNKRISVLERKLERQISARRDAERQLEKYSEQMHLSTKALQEAVLDAQKRQSELEFLSKSTSHITSEESISELFSNTLAMTSEFFDAELGVCFFSRKGKLSDKSKPLVWEPDKPVKQAGRFPPVILQYIPFESEELLEQWSIREMKLADKENMRWLVSINFPYIDGKVAWLVLCLDEPLIDEERLFVLDTAKKQLRDGVEKRLSDASAHLERSVLEQTAEHLASAKKQLVMVERMSTLGQISAGVAHEINNPIGFIKSNLEVLNDNLQAFKDFYAKVMESAEKHAMSASELNAIAVQHDMAYLFQDSLEIIADNREGIARITEIISNLKNFSHVANTDFTMVDVNRCVKAALRIAANSIKSTLTVNTKLCDSLPTIKGNQGQLQQVFINLIVNASQAISADGYIKVESKLKDSNVEISVSDSGQGMSEDVMANLFVPFYTTKPVGKGTGLGLSVSRTIIEAHRGDIIVESVEGIGTTMKVVIPI